MKKKETTTKEIVNKGNENRKHIRMDRRTFVKLAGLGAGALAFGGLSSRLASASVQVGQTQLLGNTIPKYQDPLPNFAVAGRANGSLPLTISTENHVAQILPAGMYPPGVAGTEVWAYKIVENGGNIWGPNYPAFTIEAQRGSPTNVTLQNNLTATPTLYRFITVDQSIMWADPLGTGTSLLPYSQNNPVPVVTHLHGGEVESRYDGGPNSWFTPGNAQVGPAWAQGVSNFYQYLNTQEATTLWYHDHTLGATRLNVYAGLAGFYLLRDPVIERADLPGGLYETEIVIQDRMFDTNGQLFFPDTGINPEHPFWIPEFFGDTIVVNGKTWPFMEVEPRRYRFRLLNGSNARFYNLSFGGMTFYQIGTDGGLMNSPVALTSLTIAPGERADIIVDFAGQAGNITVTNSAPAPFPAGAAPDPATTAEIMQFRVVLALNGIDNSYNPAVNGSPRNVPATMLTDTAGNLAAGVAPVVTRRLTLNEFLGAGGPLEVLVNNSHFALPITEDPANGATEVWEIVNLTADTHPIHLHLVQFQLLSRQNFDTALYITNAYNPAFPGGIYSPGTGSPLPYLTPVGGAIGGNPDVTPFLTPGIIAPDLNELGWKDTVQMNPGQVTRIAVRWMPTDVAAGAAGQFTAIDPTTGPGYVWHCHIVDHEDNEMMRPYRVLRAGQPPGVIPEFPSIALPVAGAIAAMALAQKLKDKENKE